MVATATPRMTVDEDPLAMLDAMAGGTTTKKKGSTPTVQRQDLASALAGWHEQKAKEDHHKSLRETYEAQIRAAAEDERIKACNQARDILSTVKLAATYEGKPLSVNVTQQCRYCKIKSETAEQKTRLEELKKALGESFNGYIATQMSVELTPAAVEDQDFLKGFVSLMLQHYGREEFAKRFKVTKELAPTKEFHHDYALDWEVREAVKPFFDDETLKPYKSSVKQ